MTLKPFAEKIWTCHADLKLFGIELGTRMTIIDLDGHGTLLVHSPIKLSSAIKTEVDALGEVKYVVAPNRWHHLFVSDFKEAYPLAKFFCAPGLEKKRSDFKFDGVLSKEQSYPWNPYLGHKLVDGVPIFNEVVFFHPPSKTLIVTDLAINICECRSVLTRWTLKMLGSFGKFGWAKIEKLLYIRDKAAFQNSLENILQWDFEKILLPHGTPIPSGGKQLLRAAFF